MKKFLGLFAIFALLLTSTVTSFASEHNIPSIDDVWDSEIYPYALVVCNASGEYWLAVTKSDFSVYADGSIQAIYDAVTYKLNADTGVWVRQSGGSGLSAGNLSILVYSTHDLYRSGEKVFSATPDFFTPPPPLAEVIQGVTEETLVEGTLPEMAGIMRVLALCGVGCLALLVVLKLFGKRSLISLR